MKRRLIVLSILLTLVFTTGCEIKKVDNESIEAILDTVLLQEHDLSNTAFEGYKYYLPRGMTLRSKTDYNAQLTYLNQSLYLYVDVIAYYHKAENTYQEKDSAYYSKVIENDEKSGYLEINEVEDKYFVELMYNYAKVEAYVEKKDLKDTLTEMCYVLSSIQYQDKVLATLVGNNVLNYEEETFNIFTSKSEETDFIEYVKEYDVYYDKNDELPQEDLIEPLEDTELNNEK